LLPLFVDRKRLVTDLDADEVVMKEVRDPRLEAANRRDAESR
jgi:hypothetical protein